ncbi:hypothetical protein CEXT_124781 [Caerostris extrusa]|uniref:Uncharacterized protein n=1 Tax=Caerostris extrusa TaxID=172846 RepID=A0AAV4QPH0_CAEEX|nr:hypothetical protein CEXT_124781 [Caerostris extrusa]
MQECLIEIRVPVLPRSRDLDITRPSYGPRVALFLNAPINDWSPTCVGHWIFCNAGRGGRWTLEVFGALQIRFRGYLELVRC